MNRLALNSAFIGFALANLIILAPLSQAAFTVPPSPNGYVLDEAQILSAPTQAQLESELLALDQETSTQIVVVTLTDLQGYEPEQAALAIGREWGVGQEGNDNGLIFLIAPNDRAVRIEVGYGLEGAITDAQSYQIIEELVLPAFAEGNYDEGTLAGIDALKTLARGETFELPESNEIENLPWIILFYALPLLWGFLSWLSRSKAWWVGGVFGGIFGFLFAGGLIGLGIGAAGGFLIDYVLSTYFYQKLGLASGRSHWWYLGGGRHGGGGGGFGGFGGGGFGGGGASGRW